MCTVDSMWRSEDDLQSWLSLATMQVLGPSLARPSVLVARVSCPTSLAHIYYCHGQSEESVKDSADSIDLRSITEGPKCRRVA